jgi:hypothetical protein
MDASPYGQSTSLSARAGDFNVDAIKVICPFGKMQAS